MNKIEPWQLTDLDDPYTREWFNYSKNVFPQSRPQVGDDVETHAATTYQLSAAFLNLGSFQRTTSVTNPVTGERRNMRQPNLNMLVELWGNNYAHIILTAEAGTLPTDKNELKEKYGLTGAHSDGSYLVCHAQFFRQDT